MKKALKLYSLSVFLIVAQNSRGMEQKEIMTHELEDSQCLACVEQQDEDLDQAILSVLYQALKSFNLNPQDMHTIIMDNDTNHISSNSEAHTLKVDRQLGLPQNRDRLIYHAYYAAAIHAYKMQHRITRLNHIFSHAFAHYFAQKSCTNPAWFPLLYTLQFQTGWIFFNQYLSAYFFRKFLLHVDQLAFTYLVKDKEFKAILREVMNKLDNKIHLNQLEMDRFSYKQPSQSESINNMYNCLNSLGYCAFYAQPRYDEYEAGARTIVGLATYNGTVMAKGYSPYSYFDESKSA